MQEKESLEQNIEELDQQHREETSCLLQLKNSAVCENKLLKEKLFEQEKKLSVNPDFPCHDFDLLNKDLKEALVSKMGLNSETLDSSCNKKTQNLITFLQLFSNGCVEENLKDNVVWLSNQKLLLKNNICEENKEDVNNLINKIDNYINFLETANVNRESVFPVLGEICNVINLLVSNIVHLNQELNLAQSDGENSCLGYDNKQFDKFLHASNVAEKHEASSQTSVRAISDATVQSDEVSYNHGAKITSSKHSQTDVSPTIDNKTQENRIALNQLQSSIDTLEQEKAQLQNEISFLKSVLNKTSSSAFIQTDEYVCECESLKAKFDAVNSELSKMEQMFSSQQKEYLAHLNDVKEKLHLKESIVAEKDTVIQSQKNEITSLHDKISSLIENLNSLKRENYKKEVNSFENSREKLSTDSNVGENNGIETKLLQEKITALELEKGKLLCVLNEKSQECSTLKTEVHKLTSIVASEKQALLKLQQDNCELKLSNKEKSDPELTKETIKKLSNIIRDKDFEIESLRQKNSTLTTLIQETSNIPEHLQSLLEEKENLSKQIKLYKTDREKFMVNYNMKDKECRKYMVENKELDSSLLQQREKFDILEQTHQSLVQQYEEKQKSLINAQNEMVTLKQRLADLEQQQVDIKEKYSNLLNQMNSDTIIQVTKDELHDKNAKIEQLTCANEEKDHLIQEKDCMIHDLSQQVKKLKMESEQQQQITQTLEKKISDSMNKVADMKNSLGDLENEKTVLEQKIQDKDAECSLLKDMNERLNMAVKEQEFSIQSMTEKLSSLSQYINSDHSSPSGTVDINQILADSEAMFSKAQDLYRERDETLLALNQSKQENQNLRNEIQRMKSNEIHLKNELERLRQHLLEIEENYTTEALKAEEKQKRLQDELVEVKRRAEITSTAVVDTNQRASIQIASLQEQLSIIANQRDEALSHISSLEDQVLQHSTSVNKLQLVLEQMQRANERKIKEMENKWLLLLEKEKMAYRKLEEQLLIKQRQLEESSQALEAASRLSEQLDAKEEIIANLRSELSKTENKIKSTTQEIDTIKSNTEGKVDRLVMKSLVLGYFSTPPNQKSEVIRLLARVLDFNQEEMERAGIVVGRQSRSQENRGIFSSIFGRLPRLSSEQQQQRPYEPEKSFTTLFVQFLEHESQPIVPIPFPVEKMAQEVSHHKSHLGKKPQTQQNQGSPRKSPLLLDIDSAFPTFTPVPAIEYSASPAPAILKEVLE
ncbi:unnamed protein product [Larinioides sclopetarius]